jgi:hypothetical protein
MEEGTKRLLDYSGVIHCHSTYSDGTGTPADIHRAAIEAKLDYIILTDHDTLKPLTEEGEKSESGVLFLIGAEITPHRHHYLVYGVKDLPSRNLSPQDFIEAVRRQGGIGFIAHPYDPGSKFLRLPRYTWDDWSVRGFDGIEIWNYFSEWVGGAGSAARTICGAFRWETLIRGPQPETLAKWDEFGLRGRVSGIGGLDAHGNRRRLLGRDITVMPYARAFRTVRTHVLLDDSMTGNLDEDRDKVISALKEGRAYVANWQWGDPRGFSFAGRRGAEAVDMGAEVLAAGRRLEFRAQTPVEAEVRLLQNGKVVKCVFGRTLAYNSGEPGVYRVEVFRKRPVRNRAWIFSNPIYVR